MCLIFVFLWFNLIVVCWLLILFIVKFFWFFCCGKFCWLWVWWVCWYCWLVFIVLLWGLLCLVVRLWVSLMYLYGWVWCWMFLFLVCFLKYNVLVWSLVLCLIEMMLLVWSLFVLKEYLVCCDFCVWLVLYWCVVGWGFGCWVKLFLWEGVLCFVKLVWKFWWLVVLLFFWWWNLLVWFLLVWVYWWVVCLWSWWLRWSLFVVVG